MGGIPVWLIDLGNALVWASAASVAWFLGQYTLSSPWWRDAVGRTIAAKDIALLLLLAPACVLLARPSATGFASVLVQVASLALIFLVMVWRCAVWWNIQPPRLPRPRRRHEAD